MTTACYCPGLLRASAVHRRCYLFDTGGLFQAHARRVFMSRDSSADLGWPKGQQSVARGVHNVNPQGVPTMKRSSNRSGSDDLSATGDPAPVLPSGAWSKRRQRRTSLYGSGRDSTSPPAPFALVPKSSRPRARRRAFMNTSHLTSRTITAALTATAVLSGVLAGPGSWQSYAGAANLTAASSGTSSVTIDTSSPPNSLDPQEGYTTSAGEADWIVYTPLLTYAHKSGLAGTQIIPGLATALPKITDGGTTYTMTLRPGLKYSDGTAVMASDVKFAIERALRLNWGASSFLQPIVGAAAYQAGKSSDLSGVSANDATRTIVIHLTSSIGDFSNVLCFPALSPVPQDTPMKVQTTKLPPGVGAYILTNIVPNVSYELVKNPLFASFHIPGIPLGHIDQIHIDIVSNPTTETEAVLDNQVDAMDITDTVPPALIARVESEAANRFQKEIVAVHQLFLPQPASRTLQQPAGP